MKDFKSVLESRRSVKQFDQNVKIPREEMEEMITLTTKAPSSVNMQPWRFVVVDTPEGKDILRPLVQFNTRQNDTSAAMVVIFGDMKNYEYADKIYDDAVEKGFMPQEVKDVQVVKFVELYESLDRQGMNDIVKIDSSLAAMQFMLIARYYGYDTNPIGGFEKDVIAEALGLDSERYMPVMIIAVGKAAVEGRESVRLPVEDVLSFR
ncbi:nitroreductase family protein [Staphylococcus agnetis]|uniref:nitroreductase family protein n=1 Tax=Staphylococcus agnetis TaxID=985762 RepID=UPI000CD04B5F|nr:nitroreductase family protein [Staphylococcus agnetis]MBY7664924.1 nitroreductase family protein [Staphylococcus agnetis]MCO4356682.1 nitroreductase family protein [Staphylococcus agnetis]MCO4361671.1 nitroreductase family protein [Staphylococcus agnetis]NJH78393.1 nitroreductase family protein [Staphylococcus agnetis]PNY87741.1 nitroreductase family protein [Staphylococcus agnetis]